MEPNMTKRPHGIRLVLHILAPAPISLLCYLLLAVAFVVGHLLSISVNGEAYPASFDESVLEGYANFVVQPLSTIANNELLASIFTLLSWGAIGAAICAILGAIGSAINEWRNTSQDVNLTDRGTYILHPARRDTIIRLLWRCLVGVLVIGYTALILPAVRFCLANDFRAIDTASYTGGILVSSLTMLVWILILHGYVILLRMYLLRTRVFGEVFY
jgi:hypothetical protein